MPDDPDWSLARDRSHRLNVNVPLVAVPTKQVLTQGRNKNARRDYGKEIAAQLPSPEVRHLRPHAEGDEDEDDDDLVTEINCAAELLDHLIQCDAKDYRAQYESGKITVHDLRDMVRAGPCCSTGSANDTGPVPIATDLRGNNAWPGITISPQAGTIVQSRFVKDGHNPPTNATDAPAIHHVPVSQPGPLRPTNHDTIVPGSPHPVPPSDSGHAPAQPVPALQVHSSTGNAPVATTHQQANLGCVVPDPAESPAMTAPMTPTAARSRKGPPPLVRNTKTASQPVMGSKKAPSSAPVTTPSATAPTGPNPTASHDQQHIGRNVQGAPGYRMATSQLDGRLAQPRPVHIHLQGFQPQIASPASNLFLDRNVPFPGPMSTRAMVPGVPLVTCNEPPVMRNNDPVDHRVAMFAQPAQLPGSHLHLSLPQATAQPQAHPQVHPQVQPQAVYSQLPLAHASQPHAQPPLPAGYRNLQQFSQAPEYPYAPQYMHSHEGARYAYGQEYMYFAPPQSGAYPQPYVASAQLPGGQAPVHLQQIQQQMGPAPPPPVPVSVHPQVASQAGPHAAAVHHSGAPVAAPPGVSMDVGGGNGDGPEVNPANI
ncbi:hypothetical protein FRC11_013367 [Ceratobasidium sp. 423]|nr:hypothetical protein FRC11_013367 [Ceratobasidium sp. 423]